MSAQWIDSPPRTPGVAEVEQRFDELESAIGGMRNRGVAALRAGVDKVRVLDEFEDVLGCALRASGEISEATRP